ncbi:hypothetical protein [Acinetobacter calcoaceticus]|uniref:hypothetical protein n=1 Tax=Acinetobacter calcoaceticus TaxID=471 RepID=UPI0030098211
MDLLLKYLPLIIFIYPILSWLDTRKRFSHNAKFYSERALLVKKYEEECSREGITDHEKSAFAQALAGTDKLSSKDIDIIKEKFPEKLFLMISNLLKVRNKVSIQNVNNNNVFVSNSTLRKLQFRPIWYFILYFSSIPIIILNNLLILLFNMMGWDLIYVSPNNYNLIQLTLVLVGLCIAISAALKFIANQNLISLIKNDKLIMSKEEVLKDLEDKKIKNNTQVFISYSPQGPRATTEL